MCGEAEATQYLLKLHFAELIWFASKQLIKNAPDALFSWKNKKFTSNFLDIQMQTCPRCPIDSTDHFLFISC